MILEKLAIIIPYRNRYTHLTKFIEHITEYFSDKDINYKIIIIEQDDAKLFNRGMLLNIGYYYAKKTRCDYMVFHDIDMLPVDVDYSYNEYPLHLATNVIPDENELKRETFESYFGGVTMFPTEDFQKINGYSNKYWGWGFEDDDLLFRCKLNNIKLKSKKIKSMSKNNKVLHLNGDNAYIKLKNNIDFQRDFSLTICFKPDDLKLDHNKQSDEFTIFSIPGYDFAISYTSFNRYNFCLFDSKLKAIYLNSEIKPNYTTNITLTYDHISKIICMYQDGVLIGESEIIENFYKKYKQEPNMYIGVGNPTREKIPNWFKGTFEYFAHYDIKLSADAIAEIANNKEYLLNSNFGKYTSSHNLKTYYDTTFIRDYKLIDLSPHNNIGKISNCEIHTQDIFESAETEIQIPYRRESTFNSMNHTYHGFAGNRWKDDNTRWNQLRFINEVIKNPELTKTDGLSDLQFILHKKIKLAKNIQMITVGI